MSEERIKTDTVFFRPGERNLFFHILTECNLSCAHCYIDSGQHGTGRVPLDTLCEWLALFFHTGKKNNLVFLGGEPTLHKDLAEGIKKAHEIGYASVTVDTNGFLFHRLLDRIQPDDAVLNFSLDGPDPETNDPLRGKGVFRTCTENIEKAIRRGFTTGVIYTVSRRNIGFLDRMPELLNRLGVKRFFIQVIGIRGRSAHTRDPLQLTRDEWLSVVPETAGQAARLGIEVIYPKVYLDAEEPFSCAGIAAENFFVFPNGRVYRCPLCEDLPVHSFVIEEKGLLARSGLVEEKFFGLNIPEGCVMNKLLQPENIAYDASGMPLYRISCCLLKERVAPLIRLP
jgi:MoaA/NifB/PqqE/SkfB family radical SAM enzyme